MRARVGLLACALALLGGCGGAQRETASTPIVDGTQKQLITAPCLDRSLILQPDGKALLAASKCSASGQPCHLAVVRLTRRGRLDTTFGDHGWAVARFAHRSRANSVALQPDRRILVGGSVCRDYQITNGRGEEMCAAVIARFMPNGRLDQTFATAGAIRPRQGDLGWAARPRYGAAASALAVQPDGRIIVGAGDRLVRFTRDGRLDAAFGTRGVAVVGDDFAIGRTTGGWLETFAVRPDGSIVAIGASSPGEQPTVVQYTTAGRLDPSFGARGRTSLGALTCGDGCGFAVEPSGKVLVAAAASRPGGRHDFTVTRLSSKGALDTGFGDGGTTRTQFGRSHWARANAVTVQPDGRIVAAGDFETTDISLLAVARYRPDGRLDTTFGGGRAAMRFRKSDTIGEAVAVERNGTLLVAADVGGWMDGSPFGLLLARYTRDGRLLPNLRAR